MSAPGPAVPAGQPDRSTPPGRRPPNRARSWVWGRSALVAALLAGTVTAAGLSGYTVWKSREISVAAPPALLVDPSPAPSDAGRTRDVPPDRRPASLHPSRPSSRATAPGDTPAEASATPATTTKAPTAKPGATAEIAYGPWQCGDELNWSVGHPVLAQPCHAVGARIRVVGHMKAGPGVQADISLSVQDVDTGEVAAGPYTCEALMFTDFAPEHSCGPVDLQAPHGARYVVVESWKYTGRSLLPGSAARGREFTW